MTRLQLDTGFDALQARLLGCRELTEALAEPLSAEDQTVQSMSDASPTKWHRAHTTWFFETFVLGPHGEAYQPFDGHYNFLFNSYYEAVGERYARADRGMVTRPGIAEIAAYRAYVDDALVDLLDGVEDRPEAAEVAALVELGIHHEQQHQELLLMDAKHMLANNTFGSAYLERPHRRAPDPGSIRWVGVDGGIVDIGIAADAGFRFDNEGPDHQVLLEPYKLGDRLVTSGEWLEFMADGGYEDPGLWLSDGWYKRLAEGWTSPLYWTRADDGPWQVHTLHGTRDVDLNEPVAHVSFYEADAFATWSGSRLPTEFEWEHAATGERLDVGSLALEDGGDASARTLSSLHPEPAKGPVGTLRQIFGDCWEWTGSPYRPYPRYRAPEGAIGEYNGKFMINTMVLRGGSALTPTGHIRSTYRNFFHPHTRWHLSGVRLAHD